MSNRLSGTGLPGLCEDEEGVLLRIPGVEQGEGELAKVYVLLVQHGGAQARS